MAKYIRIKMQKIRKYAYCEQCGTQLDATWKTSGDLWMHECPKCGNIEYLDVRYPIEYEIAVPEETGEVVLKGDSKE